MEHPKRRFRSAALLAGTLAALSPPGARAEDLIQALSAAYDGNVQIQAERFRLRQTDEQVPQALSGWRPTVNVALAASRIHQYFSFVPQPTETFNDHHESVELRQPLYRGGSTTADVARAEETVQAGRADLSGVEQARLLDAARSYLDVYRDRGELDLNRNLEQVLTVNLENVRSTFRAGAATETDVSQAEARLSGAVASRLAAESQLASSSAFFNTTIGHVPANLETPTMLGGVPATLDEAIATALAANPTLIADGHRVDAAQHAIDVEFGHLLPRVDAVGSITHEYGFFVAHSQFVNESVGIQATVPLYEAGGTYSRVRQAREAVAVAQRELAEAQREVREHVTAAWHALAAARAQQDSFRTQIRANEIALSDTEKEVTVGTRTRLDTLNAEQELFSSRVNLVGAEHDTLLAVFSLEAAIGKFTPQLLGLQVTAYDPVAHYDAVRDKWIGTTPPQ